MDIKSKFLHKIEEEYDDLLEMIDGCNNKEIAENAMYIAKFQILYKYLTEDMPLSDKEMEHLLKVSDPINLVVDRYMIYPEPLRQSFISICKVLTEHGIYVNNCSEKSNELIKRIAETIAENEKSNNINDYAKRLFIYCSNSAQSMDEHLVDSLLQFDNPLEVMLASTQSPKTYKEVLDGTMEYIGNNDIFTLPHKLDHDRILPESRWRHDAITQITNLVPKPDFKETMAWVDFYRQVMGDVSDNPYKELVQVFEEISNDYDSELLQQIYESNNSTMMLHNELRVLAHYLADGGDIEKVYDMRDQDMFLQSYEDLKELLDAQEQGGMDLC